MKEDASSTGFGPLTALELRSLPVEELKRRAGSGPLKSSGEVRAFGTGSVRDAAAGKGRFDLLPPIAMHALALHFERGAQKYAERNWERGQPLSVYLDSAEHHINKLKAGFDDEPHAAAAAWNMLCLIETQERIRRGILPETLDNLPKTYAGMEPGF